MYNVSKMLHIVFGKNFSVYIIYRLLFFADELSKLSKEGFGRYVDKDEMSKDHVLPSRNCFCAYVKTDIRHIDDSFFSLVRDKDCTKELYTTNYDKPIDDSLKKIAFKYAQDKEDLQISPCEEDTQSKNTIIAYCKFLLFIRAMY